MLRHVEIDDESQKERPPSPSFYDERSKYVPWYHKILLSKPLKVGIVMLFASLVAPVLIFMFLYENVYVKAIYNDGYSTGICSHSFDHRVPCAVSDKIPFRNCSSDCCYDAEREFCYHYVPSRYTYITKTVWEEKKILTPRRQNVPYGVKPNLKSVRLHFDEVSTRHLKFEVYDPSKVTIDDSGLIQTNKSYYYKIFYPEIFVEVFSEDKNVSKPLLSTARGPLVASENLWEWSYYISDDQLYGMGNLQLKSKLIYGSAVNAHSSSFFVSQRNGSYHGVYLEQDGPMEVKITGSKVVQVKSFAGNRIGVNFFYGPTPAEVFDKYSEVIDFPSVPPYWALGVHFCRGNVTSSQNKTHVFEEFYQFTDRAEQSEIPYDSDCVADGIFDFINFKMKAEDMDSISAIVEGLKNKSRRFLPTLRPHLRVDDDPLFKTADALNILFLDPKLNASYENYLYNSTVVFPDYSIEDTVIWLKTLWPFTNLTDSFVLNDNWPKVENGTENCKVTMPFINKIINTTLCESIPWNARHPRTNKTHMDDHNLYGKNHASAVWNATQDSNKNQTENFILSSSSFRGMKTGIHTQNVNLTWKSFKDSFTDAVWNAVQGKHLQSVPVCGDSNGLDDLAAEHLCIKWYLASVFLPVFRVSSYERGNHPFDFSGYARKIMTNAIKMRYKMLPYFYSVLLSRQPLIRPLFYDYSEGNETISIDEQFTVGEAIVLAPNFKAQQSSVSVYLPINETFYDLWGGNQMKGKTRDKTLVDIPTLESEIVTLLRAGYVIPIQEKIFPTATEMRMKSNYTLIVALNCTEQNSSCEAEGSLRISDAIVWKFSVNDSVITINPSIQESRDSLCRKTPDGLFNEISSSIINRIRIYGLNSSVNNMGEYFLMDSLGLDACDLKDGESFNVSFVNT